MTTPREHADDKTEQSVTDALRGTAAGGHAVIINVPGCPLMVRAVDYNTLRAQLAEAQAAQTINQYPPITTEMIYQHVQTNQARHFLRVSWKDGIDIEEPTHSVEYLLHAYADAAREGWSSPEEVRTLRAQLAEAQMDSERLDWMIEQRAYVVSDPDCCDGYWLNYQRHDGTLWVQTTEHETPRAAIDAAKGEPS